MSIITVAVSTFREYYFDWVVQLLDSLKNQTIKNFEVLLVVNSNSHYYTNLQDTINAINLPYKARVVYNPIDKGISYARNIALKNATTKYVAFTDDDVIPHPEWLKTLDETFENNNEAGAVTGPVLPLWSPSTKKFSSTFPKELYWIIGCNIFDVDAIIEVRNGFASNLAFNRKLAINRGGFNEKFGYNQNNPMVGEEPEFCIRLKKGGKPTLWNPKSIVFHRITSNRLRLQSLLARSFAEGKSKALLRSTLGRDIFTPEVTQFKLLLKKMVKPGPFSSKALLITTTLTVLAGYFRFAKTQYWRKTKEE